MNLPCFTDTYFSLSAATKAACGRLSSRENSSSLVTAVERVFSTALEPMGARYAPEPSRRARAPAWYSALKRHVDVHSS